MRAFYIMSLAAIGVVAQNDCSSGGFDNNNGECMWNCEWSGDNLSFNIELSDSGDVLAWFLGDRRDGVMYGHTIYQTGHRNEGRSLGHSFDNDSKLASITARYMRSSGDSYLISLRTATLNWDDTSRNIISAERQKYQSLELSASKAFSFGYLEAKLNFQSKVVTLTQGILPRFVAGLTWRIDI